MGDDPYRMYLVVRRGGVDSLARAAEFGAAAAVACLRAFEHDERFAETIAAWRLRPGKVCLRARSASQWDAVLEEPHACAGEGVAALPPRRRSERGPVLERLQAMSTELEPPPAQPEAGGDPLAITYALNPAAEMSSGKTIAQVAHAAVMVADGGKLEPWVAAGCPGRVIAPPPDVFTELARSANCEARVVDAGLTEVPAGTVTVLALTG